jgi:DNA-binding NarL/FixJ family response regulator
MGAVTTLVQIVADAVEVAAEAGSHEDADRMERLGGDLAERLDDPFTKAQAAYARAIVEATGDAFLSAADLAGSDLPFVRARALEHAARRLSGEARRAALAEAVRVAATLPAPGLQERASAALRRDGTAGRRAAQGVGRLTAREREVAELARRGALTREIAERLHISERTVESHLAHAYSKLGVSGRKDLAALEDLG